jgi:hypothetical protein
MADTKTDSNSSPVLDGGDINQLDRLQLKQKILAGNPESLWQGANILASVRNLWTGLNNGFVDASKAMVGENGPWKGPDADAFATAMDNLTKRMRAQGEAIGNIPESLLNAGNDLSITQEKVRWVDHQIAHLARQVGADYNETTHLVSVSQKKQLADLADKTMRELGQRVNATFVDTNRVLVRPDTSMDFQSSNGTNDGRLNTNVGDLGDLDKLKEEIGDLKGGGPNADDLQKTLDGLANGNGSALKLNGLGDGSGLPNPASMGALKGGNSATPNLDLGGLNSPSGADPNGLGAALEQLSPFTPDGKAQSLQPLTAHDLGLKSFNPSSELQGGLATPAGLFGATPDFGSFSPIGGVAGSLGSSGLGGFGPIGGLSSPVSGSGINGNSFGKLTGGPGPGGSGNGSIATGETAAGTAGAGGSAGANAGRAMGAGAGSGGMPMYPMSGNQGQQQKEGAATWLSVNWIDYCGDDARDVTDNAFGKRPL